jgi:hypothetical protein
MGCTWVSSLFISFFLWLAGGGAFFWKRLVQGEPWICRIQPDGFAKSLVAAGLCRRVPSQLSYAIGVCWTHLCICRCMELEKTNAELLTIIKRNYNFDETWGGQLWRGGFDASYLSTLLLIGIRKRCVLLGSIKETLIIGAVGVYVRVDMERVYKMECVWDDKDLFWSTTIIKIDVTYALFIYPVTIITIITTIYYDFSSPTRLLM